MAISIIHKKNHTIDFEKEGLEFLQECPLTFAIKLQFDYDLILRGTHVPQFKETEHKSVDTVTST